jgi:hypothetical protein
MSEPPESPGEGGLDLSKQGRLLSEAGEGLLIWLQLIHENWRGSQPDRGSVDDDSRCPPQKGEFVQGVMDGLQG